MKKKIYNYDFLIVGAGLIGSLLGFALIKKGFRVLVIEKQGKNINDERTIAVNANSKDFLSDLGIWNELKFSPAPINKINIRDLNDKNDIDFDHPNEPLGYVAYNSDVLNLIRNFLIRKNSILFNIHLKEESLSAEKSILINDKHYSFTQVVFSTGKDRIQNNNKINKISIPSNHSAYVGFFKHYKPHNHTAYEIFTPDGPLAVLPTPTKGAKQSTYIFSTQKIMDMKSLKKLLSSHFFRSHGKISLNNKTKRFKISPSINKVKSFDQILIGDALRSIHPVAGQGWNLGVKDIQDFLDLSEIYRSQLKKLTPSYYARRTPESFAYLTFTTLINSLYEKQTSLKKIMINTGFKILKNNGVLKRSFINQAMGRLKLI